MLCSFFSPLVLALEGCRSQHRKHTHTQWSSPRRMIYMLMFCRRALIKQNYVCSDKCILRMCAPNGFNPKSHVHLERSLPVQLGTPYVFDVSCFCSAERASHSWRTDRLIFHSLAINIFACTPNIFWHFAETSIKKPAKQRPKNNFVTKDDSK